jgi:phenylacetate-CoA ligase
MHLMSQALYVEILDPETGEETKPGEIGEIVFTDLHSRTMPFIRYEVGDTAIPRSGTCECGLALPMVEHVEGRLEDMIETPEGKKVAGGMLYYTLTKGIQQFKAYQRAVDHLHILIEPGPGFDESHLDKIPQQWRSYLGEKMKVTFEIVDRIPPDRSGKLRYFVPEADPDYVITVKPSSRTKETPATPGDEHEE